MTSNLGLHLQAEAELVAGLVQLGAVNVAGEGHGNAVPQLLLVAHADLRGKDYQADCYQGNANVLTWLLVSTLALTLASLSRANLQPMAKLEAPPMALLQVTPVSS